MGTLIANAGLLKHPCLLAAVPDFIIHDQSYPLRHRLHTSNLTTLWFTGHLNIELIFPADYV